jgi:predicted acylesterase/phospholipase RssA
VSTLAEPTALAPEPRTRRMSSPGAVLAVATLGTFMAFVDATIVNSAIPNIHEDFSGSSLTSVSWVLNAYNIIFAAFLVDERPASGGDTPRGQATRRLPSLPETLGRIALLSSANTDDAAQRYADLTISVRVSGVGLLELHQIDHAREAGRRAAIQALASDAPPWLTAAAPSAADLTGRRTVVRV